MQLSQVTIMQFPHLILHYACQTNKRTPSIISLIKDFEYIKKNILLTFQHTKGRFVTAEKISQ